MKKRLLACLLTAAMLVSLFPLPALAAEPDSGGLCPHHQKHSYEVCGYMEAVEGQPCGHVHNGDCGFAEAVEGTPCQHVHDELCGFAEAAEETPCDMDCAETDEDSQIVHAGGCAYTPAVEGAPCQHKHDADCAYAPEVEGAPCQHEHGPDCGYIPADPGQPCGYVCPICPVQAMIDALPAPEDITSDNQAEVEAQLEAIGAAWAELSDEEALQLDTARLEAVQDALAVLDGQTGNDLPLPLAEGDVLYRVCDPNGQNWSEQTRNAGAYTSASDNDTTWGDDGNDGWYVVNSNITVESRITVSGDVHLILVDGYTLTVNGGITITDRNSLTIYGQTGGTGVLNTSGGAGSDGDFYANNVNGGDGDAGIASTDGTITINGGTVNAIGGVGGNGDNAAYGGAGGNGGAGIFSANGTITINSGTVNAIGGAGGNGARGSVSGGVGGDGDAGIAGTSGTIIINGGTVNITGGAGGSGYGGAGIDGAGIDGVFSTGTDGTAFILASSISDNEDTSKWSGVIFEGNIGQVYGNPTLKTDAEIPSGKNLTIPADTTLTVPENATLTNNGTLINDGTFVNNGEAINNGTLINNGSITNIDAITGDGTIYDYANQPSGDPVSYWTCDQSGQNWNLEECRKYTVVQADTITWGVGYGQERWYVVSSNVEISKRITVSGNVHLILVNGCTLTAKNGIQVEDSDNSLTIYAQSFEDDKMGRLSASISDGYSAAIGSGKGSVITINGGAIDARGGYRSAGIGGNQNSTGGVITINGGKVIATGGDYYSPLGGYLLEGGAGIGSGRKASGGIITINGGDVTATGNGGGAGIGGGGGGTGGTITITGGTVNATGSRSGAGIGDGDNSSGGTFSTGKSGNAFIMASSISDQSDKDSWSGVIFEGNIGQVYGNPTLKTDAEIPSGKNLTIPENTTLTVPQDVTLTNNGTIIGSGTLDGEGNLEGSGTIEQTVINKLQKDSAVSVGVSSSSVTYGSTVTITATMSKATNTFIRAAANQVEFFVGTDSGMKSLGTANVNSNTATLSNVKISRENGFVTGENIITAEYDGSMGLKPQSGTATLTISKAEQTALQIANVTGKKYGDAPFTLTTTGGSGPGAVTFSVPPNNGVMTVRGDQATIIGTGTVEVMANKAGNEDYNPATATLTITIGKADALTLTNEAAMIRNLTGFTTKVDLTQTNGYPKTPGGTPTFTVTPTGYNALTSASVDGRGILTLVSDAKSGHTSDTVTVSVEGMGNYDDSTITVNITYTDKKPVTITGVSAADNLIYNGRQQQGYTGRPTSEYTGSYEISYNTQDKTAPILPGDYTVTFKVPDSDMAYVGSETLHFTIGKRPLTVKADDKTVVKGSKLPDLTYTATGLAEGDSFTGPKIETAAQDTNTTGTYNITVSEGTLTNPGGYDVSYKNGTLTVTEKIIPSLTLTASSTSLSGGGTVHLTVGGLPDGGTVTVTCSDSSITPTGNGAKWTAALPNRTADYTFTAEYSGDNEHERVTADCTVKVTQYSSGGGNSGGGATTTPTQKPSIEDSTGGSTTVTPVKPGETATIRPKPDEGYEVDKITVTDKDGKPVEVTVKPDGTYTFKQPNGKVTIKVTYKRIETPWNNPFTDVSENDWYYEAVRFVHERGLMNGYSDGRFGPNDTLSRAQLAQILFNKEGKPGVNYLLDFSDVAGEAWYIEAIRWATSQGIVGGYGNGKFGPNDPITREQLAVMLWRYSGSPAATNKELHFNDESEISGYALEALRWAVENGILNGYGDGRLGPQGQATRAQVAQMLKNFIEKQEENT